MKITLRYLIDFTGSACALGISIFFLNSVVEGFPNWGAGLAAANMVLIMMMIKTH